MLLSLSDHVYFYKPFFSSYRRKINENNIFKHKRKNETELEYSKRSALELEKMIIKIGPNNVQVIIQTLISVKDRVRNPHIRLIKGNGPCYSGIFWIAF